MSKCPNHSSRRMTDERSLLCNMIWVSTKSYQKFFLSLRFFIFEISFLVSITTAKTCGSPRLDTCSTSFYLFDMLHFLSVIKANRYIYPIIPHYFLYYHFYFHTLCLISLPTQSSPSSSWVSYQQYSFYKDNPLLSSLSYSKMSQSSSSSSSGDSSSSCGPIYISAPSFHYGPSMTVSPYWLMI